MTKIGSLVVLAGALFALSSCDLPFGLGTPSTRALENGVVASLDTRSFEVAGVYTQAFAAPPPPVVSGARVSAPAAGTTWSIDLQLSRRPAAQHMTLSTTSVLVEAIIIGSSAYFRGRDFLKQFLNGDPQARDLANAAGNSWWRGPAALVPQLPDLTTAAPFRTAFLGSAVSSRTDHVSVGGVDAVELSGARADVYVASAEPYRLLRVVLHDRVTVDGIMRAQLAYSNYDKDFGIAVPQDVIDFSNLSTLPPLYSVVSIDSAGCGLPPVCHLSAVVKNLGGTTGERAPSSVTFTLEDPATGSTIGSCTGLIAPDVGFNQTTNVGCEIQLSGAVPNAAIVTATPYNPGRAG